MIWGEAFFDEIKSLTGDSGARQLFESYKSAMNILPFDDLDLCLDADTEEDFNYIMENLARHYHDRTERPLSKEYPRSGEDWTCQ